MRTWAVVAPLWTSDDRAVKLVARANFHAFPHFELCRQTDGGYVSRHIRTGDEGPLDASRRGTTARLAFARFDEQGEIIVKLIGLIVALGALLASLAAQADAGQTHVAVAANFTEPAREIAALFKQKTGHEAVLIFGSSGSFFTQSTHSAPFEVFLSADSQRPKAAIDGGFAVSDSLFTYAIGKLVLWSRVIDVTDGEAALKAEQFLKLSIANPVAAPYGTASGRGDEGCSACMTRCQAEDRAGGTASRRRSSSSTLRGTPKSASVALSQPSRRHGGDALGGCRRKRSIHSRNPAGRGAVEDRRGQRGVQRLPRLSERSGGAGDHRSVRLRASLSAACRASHPTSGSR